MSSLTLALPQPTVLQAQILNSPAKRKVVCCGRRAGKTHLGALMAAMALLRQQKVLIASTSQDQSDVFWRYVVLWCAPLLAAHLVEKNKSVRTLEFGRGLLRVKTGRDADVLRGFDADLLILDECAFLDPDAWYGVGAAMLADRDGTALFLSTPKRKNWFYHIFQRAVGDASGRWAAFHATTHSNPHLSKIAVDELAQDMTTEMYQQEILAQFLEGDGQVFRNLEACATAQRVEPYNGEFVMGVDTGQQQDYTVMTVLDAQARRMVDMDRFRRVSWQGYRDRIAAMQARWQCGRIIYELNNQGGPNFEALLSEGLPVVGFQTTAQSKAPLIESLVLAFERQELAILDDPVLLGELGAYERKISPATNRATYSAPDGLHDDAVVALSLAWHGVANAVPLLM